MRIYCESLCCSKKMIPRHKRNGSPLAAANTPAGRTKPPSGRICTDHRSRTLPPSGRQVSWLEIIASIRLLRSLQWRCMGAPSYSDGFAPDFHRIPSPLLGDSAALFHYARPTMTHFPRLVKCFFRTAYLQTDASPHRCCGARPGCGETEAGSQVRARLVRRLTSPPACAPASTP